MLKSLIVTGSQIILKTTFSSVILPTVQFRRPQRLSLEIEQLTTHFQFVLCKWQCRNAYYVWLTVVLGVSWSAVCNTSSFYELC